MKKLCLILSLCVLPICLSGCAETIATNMASYVVINTASNSASQHMRNEKYKNLGRCYVSDGGSSSLSEEQCNFENGFFIMPSSQTLLVCKPFARDSGNPFVLSTYNECKGTIQMTENVICFFNKTSYETSAYRCLKGRGKILSLKK